MRASKSYYPYYYVSYNEKKPCGGEWYMSLWYFAYVEKKVGMQANESEVRANLLQ